jgi:nitrous oxidase accessory protein NosD
MLTKLIKTLNLTVLLLFAPVAWAETIDCTPITTLPTIITVQGIYCLTGNLATSMTSGNAIEIQTNNVVIDLNGWKLGGLAAGAGTLTTGILANQRKNIAIRNGTIRGFYYGIFLNDATPYTTSQGHLIEDIRADQNTYVGIRVDGRGNIVRRNQVVDTGGSAVNTYAYGIRLQGPGVRVLNNDVSSTAATSSGFARGLYLRETDGAVVEGNRIDDVSSGTGTAFGLYINNSDDVVAEDNNINGVSSVTGNTYGMHISFANAVVVEDNRINGLSSTGSTYGIYISSTNNALAAGNRIISGIISADFGIYYSNSTGKYMDNLTSNVTTPFVGGTAVGTNN